MTIHEPQETRTKIFTALREFCTDSRTIRTVRVLPATIFLSVWTFYLHDAIPIQSPIIYFYVVCAYLPLDTLATAIVAAQLIFYGTVIGLAILTLAVYVVIESNTGILYLLVLLYAIVFEPILNNKQVLPR